MSFSIKLKIIESSIASPKEKKMGILCAVSTKTPSLTKVPMPPTTMNFNSLKSTTYNSLLMYFAVFKLFAKLFANQKRDNVKAATADNR